MLVDREPGSGLELDESELFESEAVEMSPGSGPAAPGALASSLHAVSTPAPAAASDESDSDDDGIVLESECSSSEAEQDAVEAELVSRIQSLQSSLEHVGPLTDTAVPDTAGTLGTSHSSQVGSLKSFGGVSFKGKRLFGSEGDLAASVPVRGGAASRGPSAPMYAGRRQVAPAESRGFDRQLSASHLGTSMPISIPLLQRRGSALEMGAAEAAEAGAGAGHAATFVPPHMLHRQNSDEGPLGAGGEPGPSLGLGLSPSAKRERLLARNAILRSTGFIEVQQPPVIGEVLDPVKDSLLSSTTALPVAVPRLDGSRAPPRSGLSQLLGTSK